MTKQFHAAVLDAIKDFEGVTVDGCLDFPEFTFADAIGSFATGIDRRSNVLEQSIYEVSDGLAKLIVETAKFDPHFFDLCVNICSDNLYANFPLPIHLRFFAADNLQVSKRPTPAHRERAKNWMERCYVWSVTLELKNKYNLNITRNDASERHSASDAIAKALTSCGRKTKYTEIANLMTHSDYSRLRSEFKAAAIIRYWKERVAPFINAEHPDYSQIKDESVKLVEAEITRALSSNRK